MKNLATFALLLGVTQGCFAQEQVDSVTLVREAGKLMLEDQYEQAAEKAAQAAAGLQDNRPYLQLAAEILYRAGHTKQSLPHFDRACELQPELAPENWQRGLALCSMAKWKEGAAQFKTHHDVNPNDVENSAWYFLCVAKTEGLEAARKTVIPSRGDPREPMMSILLMLKNEKEPQEVIQAAIENTTPGPRRKLAQFYADLYVGLYYDSLSDDAQAVKYLQRSLSYDTDGYMTDAARVYLADRFPKAESQQE